MRAAAAPRSLPARLLALSGAALFFGSLAYFLYAYVVTFGAPAPAGNLLGPITWNVSLFTLFAAHHSLFAREPLRRFIARAAGTDGERPIYVWIASLLFLTVCAQWRPVPGIAWEVTGPSVWALRALQAAGIWLTLRSAAILDIRDLAGIRPTRPTGPPVFISRGPYGWVRHPIYSGWFLFVFAASPMTMTRLVFAAVSGAYLLLAIPLEERSMRSTSGGGYERYAAQVRWKLVPGVY